MKKHWMFFLAAGCVFLAVASSAWSLEQKAVASLGGVFSSTSVDYPADRVVSEAERNLSPQASLDYHTMAYYLPPITCDYPSSQYNFYSLDPIMSWVKIYNLTAGAVVHWHWYAPDGYNYEGWNYTIPYDANWCLYNYWSSAEGYPFPNTEGWWTLVFYVDGYEWFREAFYINAYSYLDVAAVPTPGGKITGPWIDCGSDCSEWFWNGTSVTIEAVPNPGWQFLYWDDGDLCYASNPITVTVDAYKYYTAKFVPAGPNIVLRPIDSSALAGRIPLILIHGNNSEKEKKKNFLWSPLIEQLESDLVLRRKYKIYLFKWDSTKDNLYNGLALGYAIDSRQDIGNKKVMLIAHSRGGLVARHFMNYHTIEVGKFDGQKGGERVKYLITLATPHRGSPGADPILVNFSLDYNYDGQEAKAISAIYYQLTWDSLTHYFLVWDDWAKEFTNEELCWDSSLIGEEFCGNLSQHKSLLTLNKNDRYLKKIIAFGGNNYKHGWQARQVIKNPLIMRNKHLQLDLGSILMAQTPLIPNGYPTTPITHGYLPFLANDGMVPLESALNFLPGAKNIFQVDARGKLTYDAVEAAKYCRVKDCFVLNPPDFQVDHLDFLDSDWVIEQIKYQLNWLLK